MLAHFLNDLALDDVAAAAMLFKVKQETVYFTPREAEEYNRLDTSHISMNIHKIITELLIVEASVLDKKILILLKLGF